MRSSCSGLALSPARMAAGSPGVSRSKRNTNSATTPITGTAASTRRNRYPSIVIHHTLRQPWDQVVAVFVPARMDQASKSCATGDPFWADVDDPSKSRWRHPEVRALASREGRQSQVRASFETPRKARLLQRRAQLRSRGDDDPACGEHVSSLQRRQEAGHQAAALGETVDFDVLVERMRIGTANAQAVEGRDSHRAGEIAVGA